MELRKITRRTGLVLGILLLLIVGAMLAAQLPAVQTYLGGKVLRILDEHIQGEITVGEIKIIPMNDIVLKDVVIRDRNPYHIETQAPVDTFATIGYLSARFSVMGLILRGEAIHVNRVKLVGGSMHLTIEPHGKTNLTRIFIKEKPKGPPGKGFGDLLKVDRLDIQDFRFRMFIAEQLDRPDHVRHPHAIDWADLDVTASIKGRDFQMKDNLFYGTADKITLREKSGLDITSLSGVAVVGKGKTRVENLHLADASTDLHLPIFTMTYKQGRGFGNFITDTRLDGTIEPSELDFGTLSHFVPTFYGSKLHALVSGTFSGPVSNLSVSGINFLDRTSGAGGRIRGTISGLPDLRRTTLEYDINGLQFTAAGLGAFIAGVAPMTALDFSSLAKDEEFNFTGSANGLLDSLSVKGELTSAIGSAIADVTLRDITTPAPIVIAGHVSTDDLDLGRIIGTDSVHQLTASTGASLTIGQNSLSARIDSVHIRRLNALDYDYTGIRATGTYTDRSFDGRIICNDPNLNLIFQGVFNLSPTTRNAVYRFYANLVYADLQALNLDKRGTSRVSCQINSNFTRIGDHSDILGDINIAGLTLENDSGRNDIGDISIQSHVNENIHRVRFNSSFLEGSCISRNDFSTIADAVKDITVRRSLPSLTGEPVSPWDSTRCDISLNFHDSRKLLSFVMPGIYIADSTTVGLRITRDGILRANLNSSRIAYNDKYLRNVNLRIDNADSTLTARLTSPFASIGETSLINNDIDLEARNDSLRLHISFKGEGTDSGDIGIITAVTRENRRPVFTTRILPSSITFNKDTWSLNSSDITYGDSHLKVNGFSGTSGNQGINIAGGWSPTRRDTLQIGLHSFDIRLLNRFIAGLDLRGIASGRALITSPSTNSGILANIAIDSTAIAGKDAGTLRIASVRDNERDAFNVAVRQHLAGREPLNITGDISPSGALHLKGSFNGFNLGYIAPFLNTVFSQMEGSLSGNVNVTGKLTSPRFSSEDLRIDSGELTLDFTKVPYRISGPLSLDDRALHFDNLTVRDRYNGAGTLKGDLIFNDFKNLGLSIKATMTGMEALNLTRADNSTFYGNAYATGTVGISGTLSDLLLDINARTSREGSIHIPLGNVSTRTTDLLTFTEHEPEVYRDPYELMLERFKIHKDNGSASNITVNLRINATPQMTAYVDIDDQGLSSLTARGSGLIDILVQPQKDIFTLGGNYSLSQGNFHLDVLGLAKRDFTIQDGSSIRFGGDIMESSLDINGLYRTKASLSNLIADSTSTRRNVECGIRVTDRLRAPKVEFSVNIPDLDPTTQNMVDAALNTQDKVQKQFLALLISGSFLPSEQSGGVFNNSNMMLSSVTEIMASQVNNIFQKLDIPLDLGLSYQSTDRGTDIFDVAISTQLFNNRVEVNGNIGNRNYNSSTYGDVVGDIDIAVKINKPGTIRATLFSHSVDGYTRYLDNSQRNGAGISYQREFTTFRQFLRELFTSRRKRARMMRQDAAPRPSGKVTYRIDANGGAHLVKEETEQNAE